MTMLIIALTAFASTAMLCLVFVHAWRGWLDLKRSELGIRRDDAEAGGEVGVRIELAAVKERLRRLEAIASGVEL